MLNQNIYQKNILLVLLKDKNRICNYSSTSRVRAVKGNFSNLIKIIKFSFILPFKSFNNKKSYVSINNLINFIILCITSKKSKNNIFHVCDKKDISLSELILKMKSIYGSKKIFINFPPFFDKADFFYIFKEKNF